MCRAVREHKIIEERNIEVKAGGNLNGRFRESDYSSSRPTRRPQIRMSEAGSDDTHLIAIENESSQGVLAKVI